VQLPAGDLINVIVPNGSIVQAVKEKIASMQSKHPADQQKLLNSKGDELQSCKPLSTYGLVTGDTIILETQEGDPATREQLLSEVTCEKVLSVPNVSEGYKASIRALTFVGDLLVSCTRGDKALHVWDCVNGEYLHSLVGHEGEIKSIIDIGPSLLLSAGSEAEMRLWDLEGMDGERYACVKIIPQDVRRLAFSTDIASVLATSGRSSDLLVWKVEDLCREDPNPEPVEAQVEAPVEAKLSIEGGASSGEVDDWTAAYRSEPSEPGSPIPPIENIMTPRPNDTRLKRPPVFNMA